MISKKKEIILNWAFSNKLIKSKSTRDINIHNFVDKKIIPELIENLNDKGSQNILLFELLHDQIISKYTELLNKNDKELKKSKEEKKN